MGRRFGKTYLGINLLLEPALQGYPVAWFAPVYRSIAEVWRLFLYYLAPAIASKNAQEKRIELYTGGVIEFWSLDKSPDLVRGRAYKRIITDESAMIGNLKQVWYLILRALLTDYKGDAWFTSTPRGFNDFYDFYQMGQSEEYPDWISWSMPSTRNPYLDPEEIESARADMPAKMFAQEYLAEFLPTLSGGMFDRSWFQWIDHVPRDLGPRVRAWDLAASTSDSADFTAGVLMAKGPEGDPSFYVIDVIRGRWSPAQRDKVIRETAERDGSEVPIVIEEEGGSAGKAQSLALTRQLAGYRLRPIRATGDKATRAAPYASQVENGNIYLLRGRWNTEYLHELESFPDPLALHDDMVDASAYAFNALIEGDRYRPYIVGSYIGPKREE
jgi:predicted phage terminase large subunit-like protein